MSDHARTHKSAVPLENWFRYNRGMADFRERRAIFAAGQRRFLAVVGPCVIAAAAILALGAALPLRGQPFPTGLALMLGGIAAALMPVARDRPGPKLALFAALCALVFLVLAVL